MIFDDFRHFCLNQIESRDIDPIYPVLKEVYRLMGFSPEEGLWFTVLYNLLYNMGSTWKLFNFFPSRHIIERGSARDEIREFCKGPLPTGVERRGFRGNYKYLETISKLPDPLGNYYSNMVNADRMASWEILANDWDDLPHNGTWARYKWCDLLKNVHDFQIEAPDIGFGGGDKASGPVSGLVILTGKPWKECATNKDLQRTFYEKCLTSGIPFNGMEELETCLCDFNSLVKGKYYTGNDIDLMGEHLDGCPQVFFEARKNVLPNDYLGELHGWKGQRKDMLNFYKRFKIV